MNKTMHLFGCLIMLGVLGGCASQGSNPQSQYYLLSSDSQSYVKETYKQVIGIKPVKVAPYINTPGIALLTRENHIRIANQHLWAEHPDQAITRVLHNELDQQLSNSRVDDGSLGRNSDWNYSIATQIDQFHGTETGEAVLSGHWQIKQDEQVISTYRFNLKQPLEKPGYSALVRELQNLLSNLAEQQAAYLQQHLAKR
ncbi:membrane integrity-associated transporter subunit PqiC [Neptuniibacter sp. QD48_55]|uniref:PqiC family protein n=1 Tax=Neptuniibacter sp. QD48_55 TaxID=3398212 RepID=UPI0039F5CD86